MESPVTQPTRPWRWVPSLYFGEGVPYVVVMVLSVTMYKDLGISNTSIALYTSWLYLPWVIKPLWAPIVDLWGKKRVWITTLQLVIGASLGLGALAVPVPFFFQATLLVFCLMAFSSATHDIAADGFYLLALDRPQQAAFVGVRSTFYRLAMIAGQGGLVFLAGWWAERTGNVAGAWAGVMGVAAVFFVGLGLYHRKVLPRPDNDQPAPHGAEFWRSLFTVFGAFFRKPGILRILALLLFYRFAEAQLLKLVTPFLLDEREVGGLGLTTKHVGIIYGTYGVIALTIGGLLGGYVVSRWGLRKLWWPMVFSINLPNLVFIALATSQPESTTVITAALALEQLGYGFGFTAYLVYMMMVADGPHKTAHYALCTGFMALGMMLPGMGAGWLQEMLGYPKFFTWICFAALPSLLAASLVHIDGGFGRRQN